MTEELERTDTPQPDRDEEDQRVYVGFHQLGGVRLVADDIRLEINEAFSLAGQLIAHATILTQMAYAEQAMARAAIAGNGNSGLVIPGR